VDTSLDNFPSRSALEARLRPHRAHRAGDVVWQARSASDISLADHAL